MFIKKIGILSVATVLATANFLHAQEVGGTTATKEQIETRKNKYLQGLQRLTDTESIAKADSITAAREIQNSAITFLSHDLVKMHPTIFYQEIDMSKFKLIADKYVDKDFVIKAQVMREATPVEYERNVAEFKAIINQVTPQSIERDQIIANQMGKAAPHFSVTDVDGVKYDLAELKGKIVVLNFWFIGCGPCKREMPELNELVEKYKGKDVVFLAFEVNNNEANKVKMIARDFHYTQVPSTRKEGDVANRYQIKVYPTSYVIDQKGIIRFGLAGYNPFRLPELDNTIQTLLKP
ncbi:TlpA family protein disulfide reductase [Sphingobacterium yanglingense]|uniref:Thiol-disulfide isomerase/thioredoxin n=1 Tax=Sphingobacterium yanglingense TaxID=1437280 RepID=A0A4R6WHC3_9SPHI|nr:TlpA disulfide reductase family protein [Sphingobacterium yanglingense]TDQ77906.1 thiol-disulfide isomerase/thioredoxin [Sphingobacterium yanglingense]